MLEFGNSIFLSLPVVLLLSVVNGAFEEFFLARYLVDAWRITAPRSHWGAVR